MKIEKSSRSGRLFSLVVMASVLGVSMLSSSNKKACMQVFVHGFSKQLSNQRRSILGIQSRNLGQQLPQTLTHFTLRSLSSQTERSVSIEDDLDSALSDILNAKAPKAKPVASSKDKETVSAEIDFLDESVRSVQNPIWQELGLPSSVVDKLSEKGITAFTPVQAEAFQPVIQGRDVIGRSRTGTGKTLAFGLPSLVRLVELTTQKGLRQPNGRMERGRPVSMIVLCPTRELARQVSDEISNVASPMGLYVDVFHGGVSYDPQARALRQGVDIVVGTPGRVIDHINRGNLDLSDCEIAVLDEADEMLNMGFAEDVEVILDGIGDNNDQKTQCLLFSATTPKWVQKIGSVYQENVYSIDATGDDTARVAKTVTHKAVKLPPSFEAKMGALEDIIAIEISRDMNKEDTKDFSNNPIAAAAAAKKANSTSAMQQKIFGKTIVFTETKRHADELVSGGVFKSLTAQAIHGDVGQKQRDATLNAFRAGSFNVLVATDVAARGIDIADVDLVVMLDPPRDVDTYVHRSGRTGRAGRSGVSVLLFSRNQERDIVRIERDLGHGFQFDLSGPPSIDAAMRAAAKTSASACMTIPDNTAHYFKEAAADLLEDSDLEPEDIVARCLAAISRRATDIQSRSLITGELGFASVQMSFKGPRAVQPGDVMFTVGKLAQMSKATDHKFDNDVGKIQVQPDDGTAIFDLGILDAKNLVAFAKSEDCTLDEVEFQMCDEVQVTRDRFFGRNKNQNAGRGGGGGYRGGGGGGGGYRGGGGGGYRGGNGGGNRGGGGGYRGGNARNDNRQGGGRSQSRDGGWNSGGGGGSGDGRSDQRYSGGGRPRSGQGWSDDRRGAGGGRSYGGGGQRRYQSGGSQSSDGW